MIFDQVRDQLRLEPDYLTLAGAGEPTLHALMAVLIERLKEITPTPVAVINNGSAQTIRAGAGKTTKRLLILCVVIGLIDGSA